MTPYHSQFGEDRILAEIFAGQPGGFCVEVGANDGINDSNSYHFELKGWRCVLVEPNPDLCAKIRATRKATLFECAASGAAGRGTLHIAEGAERAHGVSSLGEGGEPPPRIAQFGFSTRPVEVELRTLDSMLEEASAPTGIDFVSIDVEGFELAVLRGFDLARWKPRILVLEDNAYFANQEVRNYLALHGYHPFRRTGVNDWYARAADEALLTTGARIRYASIAAMAQARRTLRQVPALRSLVLALRRISKGTR